jgi:hypothetical protein
MAALAAASCTPTTKLEAGAAHHGASLSWNDGSAVLNSAGNCLQADEVADSLRGDQVFKKLVEE